MKFTHASNLSSDYLDGRYETQQPVRAVSYRQEETLRLNAV